MDLDFRKLVAAWMKQFLDFSIPCRRLWLLIFWDARIIDKVGMYRFADLKFTLFYEINIVNVAITFSVDCGSTSKHLDSIFVLHQVKNLAEGVWLDVCKNAIIPDNIYLALLFSCLRLCDNFVVIKMSKTRHDSLLSALHSLCARLLFFLTNILSKVITFFVRFLCCELIEFNFGLAWWIDNFVNLCVNLT